VEFDGELYDRSLNKCRSEADKIYIRNNGAEARLLIRAINSRSSVLLKVANEMIGRQRNFFSGRDRCFVPVSTESVARSLFLHESTVGRAVSNKTISTPRGIFELKELLPKKVESVSGEVSDHSVKEYIRNLIRNEPRNSPYSDDNLVSSCNARGIEISRRTISKYRCALRIPNSHERTKIYKMAAGT
jgi:RNA polymerase sigma-54 factor